MQHIHDDFLVHNNIPKTWLLCVVVAGVPIAVKGYAVSWTRDTAVNDAVICPS